MKEPGSKARSSPDVPSIREKFGGWVFVALLTHGLLGAGLVWIIQNTSILKPPSSIDSGAALLASALEANLSEVHWMDPATTALTEAPPSSLADQIPRSMSDPKNDPESELALTPSSAKPEPAPKPSTSDSPRTPEKPAAPPPSSVVQTPTPSPAPTPKPEPKPAAPKPKPSPPPTPAPLVAAKPPPKPEVPPSLAPSPARTPNPSPVPAIRAVPKPLPRSTPPPTPIRPSIMAESTPPRAIRPQPIPEPPPPAIRPSIIAPQGGGMSSSPSSQSGVASIFRNPAGSEASSPPRASDEIANYHAHVKSSYISNWNQPRATNTLARKQRVKTEIVIAQNGRILSAEIVQPSGLPDLDRSVRLALDSVRYLQPLPASIRASSYTVILNFDL